MRPVLQLIELSGWILLLLDEYLLSLAYIPKTGLDPRLDEHLLKCLKISIFHHSEVQAEPKWQDTCAIVDASKKMGNQLLRRRLHQIRHIQLGPFYQEYRTRLCVLGNNSPCFSVSSPSSHSLATSRT